MKIKRILSILATGLLLIGCSTKPPKPVKLDSGSSVAINQALIILKEKGIGKDPFLINNKWAYNMFFSKTDGELINNSDIVKAFYLAHNAQKIIIIGNEKIAQEYKDYFLNNQVSANITIHPVDSINLSKQQVNVIFFSKNNIPGE